MIAGGIATYLDGTNGLVLAEEGVAPVPEGANLFVSLMPDSPNNAICVYDEVGIVLDQNHYDNSDSFGTMIKFRGSYSWIREKAIAVHRAVAGLGNVWLDEMYLLDTRIQTPFSGIGTDDKGRREYTIHYDHYVKIGDNEHRQGFDSLMDNSEQPMTPSL